MFWNMSSAQLYVGLLIGFQPLSAFVKIRPQQKKTTLIWFAVLEAFYSEQKRKLVIDR